MDYPYEDLGPERFQEFCQALLAKGHHRFQCFPVGQPDGGRDAVWYYTSSEEPHFAVFQIKFVRNPQSQESPHKWLLDTMSEEAPKIRRLIPRGAKHYTLLTNVRGTAHPDAGSIDKMSELLSEQTGLPSVCLWRDDLNRKLDSSWDLKWAYPELMTGPDLIRTIVEAGLSEDKQRRANAIIGFLSDQYETDSQVRFKQVELQNNLLDLFIDVPVSQGRLGTAEQHQLYAAVSHLVDVSSSDEEESLDERELHYDLASATHYGVRRSSTGAATMLLHPFTQQRIGRMVLEGAPGQGKSTVVQYVCQVHRMRILGRAQDLEMVPNHHKSGPTRLPFKVDLRDLSSWLDKRDPFTADETDAPPQRWFRSLEAFLAAQVCHHSGGADFTQDDLLAVARVSAILIVFDGLDEVADIRRRREVVEEILRGVNRLQECAASLQVVVTSRPSSFANSPGLPEKQFPYFQLDSVTRQLIDEYANNWLRARRVDSRQSAVFRKILKEKLDQPHLRDLARNPMQLAILLSLIHTRGSSLPDKRTALYDNYVELFFSRESEKSDVVRDHRDLLIDIHRYLAWILHSEAEQGHNTGSLGSERLLALVQDYLRREGHKDVGLAAKLFAGMVERVVLLVSRVQGTYEFEVQPLREYFAARYLYDTAPYSPPGGERRGTKPDRFDAMARDFYWLNVTRFYAGCFSKGELPSLVDRLQELAKDRHFRFTSHPRNLAATLLSDWVFSQHPNSVREVVRLVLDGLGLRFVLSSNRRRIGSTGGLVLPPRCGRDELVQYCFGILRSHPAYDYALDVADLIKANSTAKDIEDTWYAEVRRARGDRCLKWLEYGLWLEVLPRVPAGKLDEALGGRPFEDGVLGLLFRARRFDMIASEGGHVDRLVQMVLERRLPTNFRRDDSILDLLAKALDARRYMLAFRNRHPVPLYEVWDNAPGSRFAALRRDRLTQTLASGEVENCFAVVDAAIAASQRPASEWACQLAPWSEVVETARGLWGDKWALFHLANIASGIKSSSETYNECSDPLDDSTPLCARARYARLRAGSATWWKRQLESKRNDTDTMFLSLVLLSWGGANALSELAEILGEELEGLAPEAWAQVYDSLRYSTLAHGERGAGFLNLGAMRLPPGLTARLAVALGARLKREDRRVIYRKYLADYPGSDPEVLEFCQREGFDLLSPGSGRWLSDLELVKRTYARGTMSEPFAFQRALRLDPGAKTLPLSIAEKIAAEADKYPGYLVGLAELRCRGAAAQSIVPVGQVALKDEWFEGTSEQKS